MQSTGKLVVLVTGREGIIGNAIVMSELLITSIPLPDKVHR